MKTIIFLSNLILPLTFMGIIIYGLNKGIAIYDSFIKGAKDGIGIVLNIFPTIVGLMVAVGVLRASGALDILTKLIKPFARLVGYPTEAIPLTLMRLVSSSASASLLLDIFKNFGPDSYLGRFVSVMMSCTETIFYTMSIYFMSIKITKTRYTLTGALIANFAGAIISLYITSIAF